MKTISLKLKLPQVRSSIAVYTIDENHLYGLNIDLLYDFIIDMDYNLIIGKNHTKLSNKADVFICR